MRKSFVYYSILYFCTFTKKTKTMHVYCFIVSLFNVASQLKSKKHF